MGEQWHPEENHGCDYFSMPWCQLIFAIPVVGMLEVIETQWRIYMSSNRVIIGPVDRVCRVFGDKPLLQPNMIDGEVEKWEKISVIFELKYIYKKRKFVWKCRLLRWFLDVPIVSQWRYMHGVSDHTQPDFSSTYHCSDDIMGAMVSQITSLTIVYSTVYSGADQRKHQRSVSLAFVRGTHRWIPLINGQWCGERVQMSWRALGLIHGWPPPYRSLILEILCSLS